MKTLKDKFDEVRHLLIDIELEVEKIEKRQIELSQLRFELEDFEKFHKDKNKKPPITFDYSRHA